MQKKGYDLIKKQHTPLTNRVQILLALWDRLANVRQLTFHAKTKKESDWYGRGKGEVLVTKEEDFIWTFNEKGTWQGLQGEELRFWNVFRWTLDRNAGLISLEHLRRGPEHPVFLLHLAPLGKDSLVSLDAHLCGEDAYFGQIHFNRQSVRLNWKVIGPKKNEEIDAYYV